MFKNLITKELHENASYERFEFYSSTLQKDLPCGLFKMSTPEHIRKSIYLLHGGGADDTQAVQAGLLPFLGQFLESHLDTQFVLPSISSSFLHDHPSSPENSFSKYFTEELIAACEQGTLVKSEQRYLAGWSMGGQAALNMFFRNPALFAGVGSHFPTLIDFDYDDPAQVSTYGSRQNVSDQHLKILVGDFKNVFTSKLDFANHNPLALIKSLSSEILKNKKIYFDVGLNDEFGLHEGAVALHEILKQKGLPHGFEAVANGKHDVPFLHAQIVKMLGYLADS